MFYIEYIRMISKCPTFFNLSRGEPQPWMGDGCVAILTLMGANRIIEFEFGKCINLGRGEPDISA